MPSRSHSLVTVTTATGEMEGQLLVNLLQEHGIDAVATGGFTSQFRAEAPGLVRVLVRDSDLQTARAVLEELGSPGSVGTQEPCESGDLPPDDSDSHSVSARLTRWGQWMGIGGLAVWALWAVTGALVIPLLSWFAGAHLSSGSFRAAATTCLVVTLIFLLLAGWQIHRRHTNRWE